MAADDCEYLSAGLGSKHGDAILGAMQDVLPGLLSNRYAGKSEWLMLWGAGLAEHATACQQHTSTGRPVAMWDLGYFAREAGYLRVSVNRWHPSPEQIENTRPDPSRWDRAGIELRETGNPSGPIVLIGMGPKSHRFLNDHTWEHRKLKQLHIRFPGRCIVFRPKPRKPAPRLRLPVSATSSIESALEGASLVVCRHSNAAVDATIAGVPFECEDGAAMWLQDRPFTRSERLDFLHRLAWWQWMPSEAEQAWKFLRMVAQ